MEKEGISWKKFNDKWILFVTDDYHGSPLIAYAPDIMIISKKCYDRYHDRFLVKIPDIKIVE